MDTNKSKAEPEAAFADRDRLLFGLTESDAQTMANDLIGRSLTDDEMARVKKGLNAGLDGWRQIMAEIIEAVKEPFSSISPEPTLLTDEEIARVRRRMHSD